MVRHCRDGKHLHRPEWPSSTSLLMPHDGQRICHPRPLTLAIAIDSTRHEITPSPFYYSTLHTSSVSRRPSLTIAGYVGFNDRCVRLPGVASRERIGG